MIKKFSVAYDYKNNSKSSRVEKGNPEINFENDIAVCMQELGITDKNIINVTTTNDIVFHFFYKNTDL